MGWGETVGGNEGWGKPIGDLQQWLQAKVDGILALYVAVFFVKEAL